MIEYFDCYELSGSLVKIVQKWDSTHHKNRLTACRKLRAMGIDTRRLAVRQDGDAMNVVGVWCKEKPPGNWVKWPRSNDCWRPRRARKGSSSEIADLLKQASRPPCNELLDAVKIKRRSEVWSSKSGYHMNSTQVVGFKNKWCLMVAKNQEKPKSNRIKHPECKPLKSWEYMKWCEENKMSAPEAA